MDHLVDSVLEKIYKSSLKLLVPATPEETYKTVVHEAIKLVGADSGTINLLLGGEFTAVYSSIPGYELKPRKRGYTYKVFKSGKPVIADIAEISKAHPFMKGHNLKSAIFIPLSYQNRGIGVLVVNTRHIAYFDEEKLKILTYFGSMVSLAIRKAQLYDEIKKALEVRDLFISMAGHELRTPLTAISGYSQLLYSKLRGSNAPEERWAEQLKYECQRLANLTNELLTINSIRTGQLHYQWKECSIKQILDRAINNVKFIYPDRRFILKDKVDGKGDSIIGDFDKLLQAITNMAENAAKFSPPQSVVNLELESTNQSFVIKILDPGIGINRKDIINVFQKYYRGVNHTTEGMGLGLFLAKEIVERHHGLIKLTSNSRKGTIAKITLPKAKI